MDGVVDVFLRLEELPEYQDDDLEARRSQVFPTPSKDAENASTLSDNSVEPPPARPTGVWDDVAWFGRLIARTVRS